MTETQAPDIPDVTSAVAAADAIVALDRDRELLLARSQSALRFAMAHSFEKEYDRRVEHFLSLTSARVG